jgi:hypothetical protein
MTLNGGLAVEGLCFWFFAFLVVTLAIGAYAGVKKQEKEDKLLKDNPQAWESMKRIELEKKDRKKRTMGSAAVNGFKIASWLLKK